MRYIRFGTVLLLCAAGCAGDKSADTKDQPAAANQPDRATAAAGVSNAIAAHPASADSILKANGYTVDSFQSLMYEIASDSAMSAKYAAAKTK